MENTSRNFKGIWIPAELWLRDDISTTQKCLIAEIDSLSKRSDWCFASNEYLAEFFKLKPKTVSDMVSDLVAKGLIERGGSDGRSRHIRVASANHHPEPESGKIRNQSPDESGVCIRKNPDTESSSNILHSKEDKDSEGVSDSRLHEAEIIYAAYPRKVGKPVAIRSIIKALRKTDAQTLLAKVEKLSEYWAEEFDKSFLAYPATWFNQERYNDDPETWKPKSSLKHSPIDDNSAWENLGKKRTE